MERPPEASIWTCRTPTSRYCAASRCAGLGSHVGDTMPTEVESPMCATEVQEVPDSRWLAAVPARELARLAGVAACRARAGVAAAACAEPLKTPANAALTRETTRIATRPATMPARLRPRRDPPAPVDDFEVRLVRQGTIGSVPAGEGRRRAPKPDKQADGATGCASGPTRTRRRLCGRRQFLRCGRDVRPAAADRDRARCRTTINTGFGPADSPRPDLSARREDALAYSGSWCQAPEPEYARSPDL